MLYMSGGVQKGAIIDLFLFLLLLLLLHRVEQQKSALMVEMNDTRAAVEDATLEKVREKQFRDAGTQSGVALLPLFPV